MIISRTKVRATNSTINLQNYLKITNKAIGLWLKSCTMRFSPVFFIRYIPNKINALFQKQRFLRADLSNYRPFFP
jgi:hypothetical protein